MKMKSSIVMMLARMILPREAPVYVAVVFPTRIMMEMGLPMPAPSRLQNQAQLQLQIPKPRDPLPVSPLSRGAERLVAVLTRLLQSVFLPLVRPF
jgi:hypothetical protein